VKRPHINAKLLIDHIAALRQHPMLADAVAIIAPESNLGGVADALATELEHRLQNYVLINMGGLDQTGTVQLPGIHTSNETKRNVSASLATRMDNKEFVPWKHLVNVGGENFRGTPLAQRANSAKIWGTLMTQLGSFMCIIKPPLQEGGRWRIELRGGQAADDLVMALEMSYAGGAAFKSNRAMFLNSEFNHSTFPRPEPEPLPMQVVMPGGSMRSFRFMTQAQ